MDTHKQGWIPCCEEATLLAERSLQQKLPFWRHMGLRVHLLYCKYCRRFLKQSRQIAEAAAKMQQHEDFTLDPQVKAEWESLISRKIN
ncbi:hypothetical protein SAMN05444266_104419 [Chitinophaga jiangningensis]|uniref:Zinc-finger n=1 Tax=Chitinophaga jiangningensis TaxID=1419482 RepID=A0A1M7CPS0_9BACT|nr:hypothetical protein [Chitinophaga jiangningensis]SHL69103.1 hypothetical protein SAMN05444266_104419 [Chitinophaga jiangningensis]